MIGYEEYLKTHPAASRLRADRMLADGMAIFYKDHSYDYALLPGNSSMDDLVEVDLQQLRCTCNVFRTKKACPHVAAALGMVEKNGGVAPYTDVVKLAYERLQYLKGSKATDNSRFPVILFLRDVRPCLGLFPAKEKGKFFLELARYMEDPHPQFTSNDFLNCYSDLTRGWDEKTEKEIAKALYENRESCLRAISIMLERFYSNPFTDAQKKAIVTQIATDEKLAAQCMPSLAREYSSYFSREQLVAYYSTLDSQRVDPIFLKELLTRLVEEEPPRYETFLKIYNRQSKYIHFSVDNSLLGKLIKAGYRDKLGKLIEYQVSQMSRIEDYFDLIQYIPHEDFLPAWKKRQEERRRSRWGYASSDWEIEVSFREDPDVNLADYNLENLGCHLLEILLQAQPQSRESVNQAVRKIYRKAMKTNNRKKALEAMMLLMRGDDAIAVKYASEWYVPKGYEDELAYLAAIGVHFDSVEKVVPTLKKLEVPNAAR